jgi:hypothetical protein
MVDWSGEVVVSSLLERPSPSPRPSARAATTAEKRTQQHHQNAAGRRLRSSLSSFLSSSADGTTSAAASTAGAGEKAGLRTVRPADESTIRLPLVMWTTTGSNAAFSSDAIADGWSCEGEGRAKRTQAPKM